MGGPEVEVETKQNPVRDIREDLGLSIREAANEAGVNYQLWYLVERGCYREIPPAITDFLEFHGYNTIFLGLAYGDWVKETREAFGEENREIIENFQSRQNENLARALQEAFGLTRSGLAKALCVQPATLARVANWEAQSLPSQLREALHAAGFKRSQYVY